MVEDYRLTREAQLQLAEGVFHQDEDYRATTFKEWLRAFEWDSARERHEPGGDADGEAAVVPAPRIGDHDRSAGTGWDDAAETERAEQLRRWHTDDNPVHANERDPDDVADLYSRSA